MRPTSEWRTRPRHSRDVSSRRESSSTPASRASASETACTATTAIRAPINAWVRVYEEDAREAADTRRRAARRRRRAGALRDPDRPQGPLRRRREAADRLEPRARRGSRRATATSGRGSRRGHGAARPPAHARVRLRRHHRPGRQPVGARALGGRLERRVGAALASRQVPAATGTDTAGSLRIPSAECGTSTIKPTRGLRLDARDRPAGADLRPSRADDSHGAPTASRCSRRMAGVDAAARSRRPLRRYAVSPRIAELDPDVADGFERALAALPGERVEPPPPEARLDVLGRLLRPRPDRDARLPPPLRRPARSSTARRTARRLEHAERAGDDGRGVHRAARSAAPRTRRAGATGSPSTGSTRSSSRRSRSSRPLRGQRLRRGVRRPRRPLADPLLGLDRFPGRRPCRRASGRRSGLPVSVSLIGAPGADWDLLDWGAALQGELGTVTPP